MARVGAELRRQDFVKAAISVIAEHGVANATTRRIAAAADSPLASLHYVFSTKDDLFYAVFESLVRLPPHILEKVQPGLSAADTATEMLRKLVKWFVANPDMATAQVELYFWSMRNQPEMTSKIYELSLAATEQSIARATNLPPSAISKVSRLIIIMFDGLLTAWLAQRNDERLEADTDAACEALRLLVEPLVAA